MAETNNKRFSAKNSHYLGIIILTMIFGLWGVKQRGKPQPPRPREPFLQKQVSGIFVSNFLFAEIILSLPDLFSPVDKEQEIGNYAPSDLVELSGLGARGKYIRQAVVADLRSLMEDMKKQGKPIKILSAYRSFSTQRWLYAFYKRLFGDEANRFSAQAGHSEHQLGTTIDFGIGNSKIDLTAKFAATPQGIWLEANAFQYGFVQSYPAEKEEITGYMYEPWHYRYIGKESAQKWHESGLTLREFLQAEEDEKK